jgi:hypothetical protein
VALLVAECNSILNALLPGASHASYSGNTSLFMSIHTADPGQTGANEFTDVSPMANRPGIAFGAAASGSAAGHTAVIDWTFASATTITHVGLKTTDVFGTGTFKGGGALAVSKSPAAGDILRFAANSITVTLA